MNQDLPLKRDPKVSFMDIAVFLMGAYKTILIFGIFGLVIGIGFFWSTPKKYEAVAQISVAQVIVDTRNNLYSFGVNIEEPAFLILLLASPMSFDLKTISACGLEDKPNAGTILSKSIKLATLKGADNIISLKVFGPSPAAAFACANAVFELIKAREDQIIAPYIEGVKLRIVDNEERLKKAKDLLLKIDKFGSLMGVAYLTVRDEIKPLTDEIIALKNIVANNQDRATRLIVPIYASQVSIAPKMNIYLPAGLFGGLFLGLLIVLGRLMIVEMKAQAPRVI